MAVVWIWDAVMMVQHNHITRARKKENLCGYPRCNDAAIRATCGLFCSRVEGQDGYVACMASDCAPRLKSADYMAPEEIKTWKELDQRLRPLEKSGIGDLTSEDKGKLLYVSADGVLVPLKLGAGLAIVNGVLTLTNADTGETVEINARIVGGVLMLTDSAETVGARIVDGVLVVSDPSGNVKARIEDDVLICEMEE